MAFVKQCFHLLTFKAGYVLGRGWMARPLQWIRNWYYYKSILPNQWVLVWCYCGSDTSSWNAWTHRPHESAYWLGKWWVSKLAPHVNLICSFAPFIFLIQGLWCETCITAFKKMKYILKPKTDWHFRWLHTCSENRKKKKKEEKRDGQDTSKLRKTLSDRKLLRQEPMFKHN